MKQNKEIYETFLNRFKETSAVSDIQPVNARIVDPAVLPTKPTKPKKALLISLTLIISFIFALCIVLLIDALDNTLKNTRDLEEKLKVSALGILPMVKSFSKKKVKLLEEFTKNKKSIFFENVKTVRSSLLLSGIDNKQKVVLVTSSISGEGKTTVAINLALSFAQMGGKVLLIDADMRRPFRRENVWFKYSRECRPNTVRN